MTVEIHKPVLLKESLEALQIQHGGRYIDCTVGQGGHSQDILQLSSPGGQLLGIDADPLAIKDTQFKLRQYDKSVLLVNDNFNNLNRICTKLNFRPVQGIIFDLGMSSIQLADETRGFSFQQESPLDMRFSPNQQLTAGTIVNNYTEKDLALLIWNYGEERKSRQIAKNIIKNRPVQTTLELATIVKHAVNSESRKRHPATKTFQALRIAVNREVDNLGLTLDQAVNLLGFGGRLVVISFHSLEDRIVKEFMRRESRSCICPPESPICTCTHSPRLKLVNRSAIQPTSEEVQSNPRSRSAKLRVAERIGHFD